jgi:hypothetical protein
MNRTKFGTYKVYLVDFIVSAIDPDKHKRLTHFRSESRARNAFNASVNEYRNGNFRSSVSHIGHCFHYIQDLGDPSKSVDNMFHRSRKDYIRRTAEDLLSSSGMRNSESWSWAVSAYSNEIQNKSYDQTISYLKNKRSLLRDNYINLFETYRGDSNTLPRAIRLEVLKTLALTVAVQNRILDIFSQKVSSRNSDRPVYDSDFGSESNPRPTY